LYTESLRTHEDRSVAIVAVERSASSMSGEVC
jgi:hypothetical protein